SSIALCAVTACTCSLCARYSEIRASELTGLRDEPSGTTALGGDEQAATLVAIATARIVAFMRDLLETGCAGYWSSTERSMARLRGARDFGRRGTTTSEGPDGASN